MFFFVIRTWWLVAFFIDIDLQWHFDISWDSESHAKTQAVTFSSLLAACAKAKEIKCAEHVCPGRFLAGNFLDGFTEDSMVAAWIPWGSDKIPDFPAIPKNRRFLAARFLLMQQRGIQPNIFTYTSLVPWRREIGGETLIELSLRVCRANIYIYIYVYTYNTSYVLCSRYIRDWYDVYKKQNYI